MIGWSAPVFEVEPAALDDNVERLRSEGSRARRSGNLGLYLEPDTYWKVTGLMVCEAVSGAVGSCVRQFRPSRL